MTESPRNGGPRQPPTRPFASNRTSSSAAVATASRPSVEATVRSSDLSLRPLPFTGSRTRTAGAAVTRFSANTAPDLRTPTPHWTVAVYEPGLEHVAPGAEHPSRDRTDDLVEASLALSEDVVEAGRHATSATAADVLEVLAGRLRRGEILLLPGASTKSDVAIVSAVLAALLGGRR